MGEARGTSAEEFQGSVYVILYNQQGDMVSSEGDLQLSYSGDASTVKSKTIRLAPSAFKVQRIAGEDDDTLAALVDSFPGTLGKTLEVEGKFDSRLTSESELEFGSSFEESDSDAESEADVETEGEDSDDAETVR